MIQLNQSLTLVQAATELLSMSPSHRDYAKLLADAADLLERIEAKHAVHIIPYVDMAANCLVPNERPSRLDVHETIHLLRRLAQRKTFHEYYRPGEVANEENGNMLHEGGLAEQHLYPFLSETELIIQGADFAGGYAILFPGGQVSCWSLRGWGGLLAKWANEKKWHPEALQGKPWSYAHFYIHLPGIIERYDDYEKVFKAVLNEKIRKQVGMS